MGRILQNLATKEAEPLQARHTQRKSATVECDIRHHNVVRHHGTTNHNYHKRHSRNIVTHTQYQRTPL